MKKNHPFGVLYYRRNETDKDSEFLNSYFELFQNKELAPCENLTDWVRWGDCLFRWYEVFWYLGYNEGNEHDNLSHEKLHKLAHSYIGEQPIKELLKEIDNYLFENKEAFFYARIQNLSRAEMEKKQNT